MSTKTFDDYPSDIRLAVLRSETEALLTSADRIERHTAATRDDIASAYAQDRGVEDYWAEQQECP
jgi:hypothetical protein